MSNGIAHLMQSMGELLYQALWTIVAGFAVIGATFYGGPLVYSAWKDVARRHAQKRAAAASIARETAEGIAAIETFLATQAPVSEPTEPTSRRQERDPRRS